MRRRSVLILVVSLLAAFAISCSSSSTNSVTAPSSGSPASTLTSITVSSAPALTTAGQQGPLTVTAHFADGSTQDVTSAATWQSSNGAIATVSASGIVTAVGSGAATITVTYQGKSTTVTVSISISTQAASSLTATIDGAAFNGLGVSVGRVTVSGTSILSIGGASGFTGDYNLLTIAFPGAAGTYTIGGITAIANGSVQIPNQSALWQSNIGSASGSIVVTSVTANSAAGTFSLNLVPLPGTKATGTKVVTGGAFNVKF